MDRISRESVQPESELAAIEAPACAIDAQGLIEDANAQLQRLVGVDARELIGAPIDRVLSRFHLDDNVLYIPESAGVTVRTTGGAPRPVEVFVCPRRNGSRIVIACAANRGLCDDDIAHIVHDLKSPLQTISLETYLLHSHIPRGPMRTALDRVEHNIQYLDRLIEDLLDVCALDVGALVLDRLPVDVRELLQSVIARAVPSVDQQRVVLDAPETVTLVIDRLRIERVVANLIANALKHARRRSPVSVRLALLPEHVRISVSDSGVGLLEEQIAHLFDGDRRRGHGGHGIGLYISRQIVEAHGGRIAVDSVRGVGSHFHFELPRP